MELNYYNELKAIPKNETSYAYYARTTDKPVTIFADFETTSQSWVVTDENDKPVISYKSNIDLKQFMFDNANKNYHYKVGTEPVKVWLAGAYVLEEKKFYYMTDIEHFVNFISQYKLANVYFHNGGNFDFRFIHDYLTKSGFQHLTPEDRHMTDKFFVGDYSSSTIYNEGQMINLRDTLDIIKSSIGDMGDNLTVKYLSDAPEELQEYYKYNKEKKFYQLAKGDTPIKYIDSNLKPSSEDLDYLAKDVMILTLSSTRADSYDLPKFFSNGLRTTASLAEAYLYQPSLKDELVEKEFRLDNTTKKINDLTRFVTGYQYSDGASDVVPVYRDNGSGGKRTENYIPRIDEQGWLHSNFGIHSHGEKYLKSLNMKEYHDLSYEWNGDYLEYKVKKSFKTKIEKIADPNTFDGDVKLEKIPLPKKYNYDDKKVVSSKGRLKGKNYTEQHISNLKIFGTFLWNKYNELGKHIVANEAMGINSKITYGEKKNWTIKGLRTELASIGADFKKVQTRILQEQHMLDLECCRDWVYNSYKGGHCFVNPVHQNKWIEALITVIDINSMYPWIYSSLPLPGKFKMNGDSYIFKEYDENEELGFVVINKLKAKAKNGKLPFYKMRTDVLETQQLQRKPVNSHDYYLREIDIDVKHCITLLEYRSLLLNYDIEEIDISHFYYCERNTELMETFKNHADYWMRVKEKAKKEHNLFMVMFSKLMLNSPYGKLGNYKKNYQSKFTSQIDDNGIVRQISLAEERINKRTANIEAASYITAYARVYLSECINAIGLDKFLYCDTDSIHYIGTIDDIEGVELPHYLPDSMREITVHDTMIGAWAAEAEANKGKYIKPKCYGESIVKKDGKRLLDNEGNPTEKWSTTVAGVTGLIPEDHFKAYDVDESSPIYTLRSMVVDGGVSLYLSNFKIKTIPVEYEVANKNYIKALAKMSQFNKHSNAKYLLKHDIDTI